MRKDMWIRPLKGLCGFGLISFTDVLPDAVGISCCVPVNHTSLLICWKRKKTTFPSISLIKTVYDLTNSILKDFAAKQGRYDSFESLANDTIAIKEGRTRQNRMWTWLRKRGVLIGDTWDMSPTEHAALNGTRQGNAISQTVIQNNGLASSRNGSVWLFNCLQACQWTNWNLVRFFSWGLMRSTLGGNPRRGLTTCPGERNSLSLQQKKTIDILFNWRLLALLVTNWSFFSTYQQSLGIFSQYFQSFKSWDN